jgi:hypothetical protein
MGIGSDPCTPFYILFTLRHPNDVPMVAVQKKNLFSMPAPKPSDPPGQHPLRIQYAVERRGIDIDNRFTPAPPPALDDADFGEAATLPGKDQVVSSLVLRWREDFVETRASQAFEIHKAAAMRASLIPKKKKLVLSCLAPEKLLPANTVWGLTTAKSVVVTDEERRAAEVRVGRIYHNPTVTPIGRHSGKFFSTLEEVMGAAGINLFYSSPGTYGNEAFYWFNFDDKSWKLVIKELPADWNKNGPHVKPPVKKSSLEKLKEVTAGMKKALAGEKAVKQEWKPPDHGFVAELVGTAHNEPLIHFDLVTGQLWTLKTVPITLLDIAVTLLGAVFNLEEDIRNAVNFKIEEAMKSSTWSKEMKELKKDSLTVNDWGCI